MMGQRRFENNYVKYEAKFLAWHVFGWAGIFAAVLLMFVHVILPAMNRKTKQVRAELKAMARVALFYSESLGEFPDSFGRLRAFAKEASEFPVPSAFPQNDPWKRDYTYFNITDERVALASAGRNGRLDIELDVLSAPVKNEMWKTDSESIFIYVYAGKGDDWVYLVGVWPSQ